jgi:hypothetical protein
MTVFSLVLGLIHGFFLKKHVCYIKMCLGITRHIFGKQKGTACNVNYGHISNLGVEEVHWKQGITNMLALAIDTMLYIYLLCEHQKHLFRSKQSKHFHQRNQFNSCETGFNKVKLPKVGSNAIILVPLEAGPNKRILEIYMGQLFCSICFDSNVREESGGGW